MNLLKFDRFTIDPERRQLLRDGEPVALTPKTFDTLLTLVRERGRVVEKSELMELLWPVAEVEEVWSAAAMPPLSERRHGRRTPYVAAAIAAVVLAALGFTLFHRRAPQTRSLAVLPFKSLGGNDDAYLGLGMADVLITRLSNVHGLVVRRAPRADQDPLAAGRDLRTDSVLDGTIQHTGDRVRVTVRLWSVNDGRTVWGDELDEKFTGIFAVEDAIAERLASALALQLPPAERQQLTRRYTENAEAHRSYLRGVYFSRMRTVDGFDKAVDEFHHAIALDPSYALGYAGLADAYYRESSVHMTLAVAVAKSRAAATTALQLDDSLAEAHAALAQIKFRYDWDFAGAERQFRRAIALNPNDPTAHQWFSECLTAAIGADDARLLADALVPGVGVRGARRLRSRVCRVRESARARRQRGHALAPGALVRARRPRRRRATHARRDRRAQQARLRVAVLHRHRVPRHWRQGERIRLAAEGVRGALGVSRLHQRRAEFRRRARRSAVYRFAETCGTSAFSTSSRTRFPVEFALLKKSL